MKNTVKKNTCKNCDTLTNEVEYLKVKIKELKNGEKPERTEKEKEILAKRKERNAEKRQQYESEQKEKEEKFDKIQKLNIELQEKLLKI